MAVIFKKGRAHNWVLWKTATTTINLYWIVSLAVKRGTPPDVELEKIGVEIAEKWEKLGRRLGVSDARLAEIYQARDQLSEKGYHMLKHWKQNKGSDATYQALCDALRDGLVQRLDLAEKFCYIKGNYFIQYNMWM